MSDDHFRNNEIWPLKILFFWKKKIVSSMRFWLNFTFFHNNLAVVAYISSVSLKNGVLAEVPTSGQMHFSTSFHTFQKSATFWEWFSRIRFAIWWGNRKWIWHCTFYRSGCHVLSLFFVFFFIKISIFLVKISIFCQNFYFLKKFEFFDKIWIFWQNFDFLTNFRCFVQNFDFWSKLRFWSRFRFLIEISIF